MEKQNKIIELGRCFSCKKAYMFNLLKPIMIIEPLEDGVIRIKRHLCPSCFKRLQEVQFTQECDLERKKVKKEVEQDGKEEI